MQRGRGAGERIKQEVIRKKQEESEMEEFLNT